MTPAGRKNRRRDHRRGKLRHGMRQAGGHAWPLPGESCPASTKLQKKKKSSGNFVWVVPCFILLLLLGTLFCLWPSGQYYYTIPYIPTEVKKGRRRKLQRWSLLYTEPRRDRKGSEKNILAVKKAVWTSDFCSSVNGQYCSVKIILYIYSFVWKYEGKYNSTGGLQTLEEGRRPSEEGDRKDRTPCEIPYHLVRKNPTTLPTAYTEEDIIQWAWRKLKEKPPGKKIYT